MRRSTFFVASCLAFLLSAGAAFSADTRVSSNSSSKWSYWYWYWLKKRHVNTAPIPSTLLLFGTGLAGLGIVTRKRRP